ncbi:MAG: uracil-DNA glycosylase, partial [Firmicutes bacterium]|nr:uracil-DNA glycosylase [Bacillota bacterium]
MSRQSVVFGEGNPAAKIFLLGEAPGAQEDACGRPFVGRAGKVLDQLLSAAGLTRQDVFITGSVKCRPPKNRNPYRSELAACRPWLEKQLALIKPQVVVCLGLVAVQ